MAVLPLTEKEATADCSTMREIVKASPCSSPPHIMLRHFVFLAALLLALNAFSSLQAPVTRSGTSTSASVLSPPAEEAWTSIHDPSPSERSLIRTYGKRTSDTETLSELVNKRPAPRTGKEAIQRYQALFAKHAKVQELDKHTTPMDLKALTEGWNALRREEKGYYHPKKMAQSIEDHLRDVAKLPEDVVEAVRCHWDSELRKNKGVRFRQRLMTAVTPKHAAMYQARLKSNVGYTKELRARRRQGIVPRPFEDYMAAYEIPSNLSAKELEVRSRAFRHEYGKDAAAATLALKKYMQAKGYEAHHIALAVGERGKDCKREQGKRYRERRRSGKVGREPTPEQQTVQDDGQVRGIDRKRKIQEMLASNKEWYKTSNL